VLDADLQTVRGGLPGSQRLAEHLEVAVRHLSRTDTLGERRGDRSGRGGAHVGIARRRSRSGVPGRTLRVAFDVCGGDGRLQVVVGGPRLDALAARPDDVADDLARLLRRVDPREFGVAEEPADVVGIPGTEPVDRGVLLARLERTFEDEFVTLVAPVFGAVLGVEPDVLRLDVLGDGIDERDVDGDVSFGPDHERDGRDREVVGLERLLHGHSLPPDLDADLFRVGAAHTLKCRYRRINVCDGTVRCTSARIRATPGRRSPRRRCPRDSRTTGRGRGPHGGSPSAPSTCPSGRGAAGPSGPGWPLRRAYSPRSTTA